MRFCSLNWDSLCINPCHSPSLLWNKRKRVGVLFLAGQQGAGLETKLAALNSHHRQRHCSCLKRTMKSGCRPCRRLGLHLGISLGRDMARNHARSVDHDGKMLMPWHGRTTRLTGGSITTRPSTTVYFRPSGVGWHQHSPRSI